MKRSIKRLPKQTQEELNTLLELITRTYMVAAWLCYSVVMHVADMFCGMKKWNLGSYLLSE